MAPPCNRSCGTRVDVNEPEGDGTTALHWAVQTDDLQMVDGADQSRRRATVANRLGVTPMALAATNGSAAVIEALLKAGANPNEASRRGRDRADDRGAHAATPAAVNVLLKAGASVNATEGWRGETALMWAAAENHAAVVKLLIDRGADNECALPHAGVPRRPVQPGDAWNDCRHPQGGFTALMFAARQGALDAARALADAGADLNVQDPDGTPALTIAIVNGHQRRRSIAVGARRQPECGRCRGHDAAVCGGRTAHGRDVSRAEAAAQIFRCHLAHSI